MMKENPTPDRSKPKLPAETDEVIRDLIQPEDLEEQDESDGPRDPTTQDRDLLLEPFPTETEAVTNAFSNIQSPVVEPLADSSTTSSSEQSRSSRAIEEI